MLQIVPVPIDINLPGAAGTPSLKKQKELAEQLKNARLDAGIGSKYLKQVIGLQHVEVFQHPNFIMDVEYGRILITDEIWRVWLVGVKSAQSGEHNLQNPCDICSQPTGSWLYDTCRNCIQVIARDFKCQQVSPCQTN